MTTFYAGQLVRIKYVRGGMSSVVGCEGRILEILSDSILYPDSDCIVETTSGVIGAPTFAQLEPLTPSGHQPAELSVEELLPFLKPKERV